MAWLIGGKDVLCAALARVRVAVRRTVSPTGPRNRRADGALRWTSGVRFGTGRKGPSSKGQERSAEQRQQPSGHRRVTGEGQDDLGLSGPGIRRGGEPGPRA